MFNQNIFPLCPAALAELSRGLIIIFCISIINIIIIIIIIIIGFFGFLKSFFV